METKTNNQTQEKMKLDDARRVKSMSPTQMVMKRFTRNKLAVTGMIILIVMFIFSFLGPVFSPYTEAQVFRTTEYMVKDYAGAVENKELSYISSLNDSGAAAQFKKALSAGETAFSSGSNSYTYEKINEDTYVIYAAKEVVKVMAKGKANLYTAVEGFDLNDEIKKAFEAALKAKETSFTVDDQDYVISAKDRGYSIGIADLAGIATRWIIDSYDPGDSRAADASFKTACAAAIAEEEKTFEWKDETFTIEANETGYVITDGAGGKCGLVSTMKINAKASDIRLSGDFRTQLCLAVRRGETAFSFTENETTTDYTIEINNGTYLVKANMPSEVRLSYEGPTKAHLLGTDANGMDVMTRLMYGGRVSLLVGFVVVFIELAIGVLIGGISGFFGGWLDTALMRFVDLVNSIPFWPMVLIFGSVMDSLELSSTARLFILMAILGLLNWTGIARVVRGQILTLREQDFMVATEATGIRVSRRIFRHLVPNVMPLLIVQATMSLGGIILTEATMSFLGLGVKYPMASWGSIINAANDIRVMTSYWFIWLPAGMLIMLTVLGFNFVGDGLRDAFDPRMKR